MGRESANGARQPLGASLSRMFVCEQYRGCSRGAGVRILTAFLLTRRPVTGLQLWWLVGRTAHTDTKVLG